MSGPSDLYDWTPEQRRAVIHLESLLRARRAQPSPSPVTAPDLPPDCLSPGRAAAGEPINAADWIGLAQVCALVLAVDGIIWLISVLLSLINI